MDKKLIISKIKRLKASGKVLDIGCGEGLILRSLEKKGFKTTGIDFSEEKISRATIKSPNSNLIWGDFIRYNFTGRFDVVLAISLIHLFPKKEIPNLFEKIKNRLYDDGLLVISCSEKSFERNRKEIEKHFKKIDFFENESKWITLIMKK